MSNEDTIKVTLEELKKLLSTNSVVGEPIETETVKLIPIVKIGFGFGAGNGNGKDGGGSGSGAAAGVEPISMVVVPKGESGPEDIKVIDVTKRSNANKAINDLATIVTSILKEHAKGNPSYQEANWEYKDKNENTESDIKDAE